ncbi:GNAT family N-acetyltransferase [Asanoa sp. WMMD1127]|uniref:GNAT family N-acetyltransferase n=1 Tax=Asanoa sp. WMMD1127 TaxID=3016107 RepID=UPI0024180C7A|nr:GNAT family N-acetyltransferase [Asanoa sp. WMMD1127]MDG4822164.1 GNAT family N-acetyltransferase [Asanoa sp. WMMD1127]
MRIRTAKPSDFPTLQNIERAAGHLFRTIGMPEIADDDPPTLTELAKYEQAGTAWVATTDDADHAIAYLVAEEVDGSLHIEQVTVHPSHAHQGIGRRLIDHASEAATARGLAALTLTTFRDVPWNAPYYEQRCGFTAINQHDLTPGLEAIQRREADHGLNRWPRICMRRPTNG